MEPNSNIFGNEHFNFHKGWVISANNPQHMSNFHNNINNLLTKIESLESVKENMGQISELARKLQGANSKINMLTSEQLNRCDGLYNRNSLAASYAGGH